MRVFRVDEHLMDRTVVVFIMHRRCHVVFA